MPIGVGIDPDQGLSRDDELKLMRHAAELGYESAWTPSGPDASAFDRCIGWYEASGLPTGISAVPAAGQPAAFYAEQAKRAWESTKGTFTLVVGSGQWTSAAERMRGYLPELRQALGPELPLYLAALGPLMLAIGAQLTDGVALNWCTAEQVAWSRQRIEEAARSASRPAPRVIQYIRIAVDPDPRRARQTVAASAARYLAVPAYRRHFERMGVAADLERATGSNDTRSLAVVERIGAAGQPGQTRAAFDRLAVGLDLPIVRVLVTTRGDLESANRVLEECKPA